MISYLDTVCTVCIVGDVCYRSRQRVRDHEEGTTARDSDPGVYIRVGKKQQTSAIPYSPTERELPCLFAQPPTLASCTNTVLCDGVRSANTMTFVASRCTERRIASPPHSRFKVFEYQTPPIRNKNQEWQ